MHDTFTCTLPATVHGFHAALASRQTFCVAWWRTVTFLVPNIEEYNAKQYDETDDCEYYDHSSDSAER